MTAKEGVAVLRDDSPVRGELHGSVADDRRLQIAWQRGSPSGWSLPGWGAQYDVIAVERRR